MNETVVLLLLLWNAVVFALYGIDKRKAVSGAWRISEKTLICMAFLMGAPGAFLGMQAFRHKTRKRMFVMLIDLAVLVNVGIFIFIERI